MPISILRQIPSRFNSFILSAIDISTVEISRHRIDTFLVHIELINLNRVPIIEIILTVGCLETIDVSIG